MTGLKCFVIKRVLQSVNPKQDDIHVRVESELKQSLHYSSTRPFAEFCEF